MAGAAHIYAWSRPALGGRARLGGGTGQSAAASAAGPGQPASTESSGPGPLPGMVIKNLQEALFRFPVW